MNEKINEFFETKSLYSLKDYNTLLEKLGGPSGCGYALNRNPILKRDKEKGRIILVPTEPLMIIRTSFSTKGKIDIRLEHFLDQIPDRIKEIIEEEYNFEQYVKWD